MSLRRGFQLHESSSRVKVESPAMAQFPGPELVLHPVFRSELLKEVHVERDTNYRIRAYMSHPSTTWLVLHPFMVFIVSLTLFGKGVN